MMILILQMRNQGTERLGGQLKVTCLTNGRAEAQIQCNAKISVLNHCSVLLSACFEK